MAGNGTLEVLAKGTTTVFAADVRNTAHYNQSEVGGVRGQTWVWEIMSKYCGEGSRVTMDSGGKLQS